MSILLLVAVLAATLLVLGQYVFRSTAIRELKSLPALDGAPGDELAADADLLRSALSLLTGGSFVEDARVELLFNGDQLFSRLFEELARAEHYITFQVFWVRPGSVADRLREILVERARAGVQVFVLLDYFGAWGLGADYREALRQAGVHVAVYRPLHIRTIYKFQQRSHVRAVIMDGRVGFTGGFGIDDSWAGSGRRRNEWRDTSVRLEGRVVDQLQSAFLVNWAEATGDLLLGSRLVVPERTDGPTVRHAAVVHASPDLGSTTAERLFFLALASARRTLFITNAYFVPDEGFRAQLVAAVRRGVDVRVLTPGRNSDRLSAFYAGRGRMEELLEAGVRIYEYVPTMVHAKTMAIDGHLALVGTINFDTRSMALNEEVAAIVQDSAFASRLEEAFFEDLEYARELDLEFMRKRPWTDRLKEQAAQLVAPLL